MINRDKYLEKLKNFKDKDLIKVITGIRRCGKSTLFELYIEYLKSEGIESNQIIKINLENPEYNFSDYMDLYNYVKDRLIPNKKNYVFLDEVQNVDMFQKAVDGLYIKKNVDLYITGSNAYLLSGELATLLSGRYIEIKMLPLSFKEYASQFETDNYDKLYMNYANTTSFPYALNLDNEDDIAQYISNIYDTILLKDVVSRKSITDVTTLQSIVKFMFSNIGSILSTKKVADTLTSNGRKISVHTVESYIESLIDSFIFNKVSRYDIKGKQYLKSGEKYYATDIGMRYAILGKRYLDMGHILENIVYLELIRRGYKVYIGKVGEKEVDFIAENRNGIIYYQVALTTRDEDTLKRELIPLQEISDHYPKYILTMDLDPEADFNGIRKINVIDWLLNEN